MPAANPTCELTTETGLAAIVRRETPNIDTGSYDMLWFRRHIASRRRYSDDCGFWSACMRLMGHNDRREIG
jgi:hypothetical protein